MSLTSPFLATLCVSLLGIYLVSAAQYCESSHGIGHSCAYGCCYNDNYDPCCTNYGVVLTIVVIVCCVVGGLLCICFIVACVCCCLTITRIQRRNNMPQGQQQHIALSPVHHQMTVYPQSNTSTYPQPPLAAGVTKYFDPHRKVTPRSKFDVVE